MGKEITVLNNELFFTRQNGRQLERITDSNFKIEGCRYLLECQTNPDGTMLLRIFEYSTQLAVRDSELEGNELYVKFPVAGLLYLRHHQNTPDTMRITIEVPGAKCSYDVPVMKVKKYTVDEIFEKKLYFLIPFHLFVYEKEFAEYNQSKDKLRELLDIYTDITKRLNEVTENGEITLYIKCALLRMARKVLANLSGENTKVREGVDGIMGGTILDYPEKDILRAGIEQGLEQGIEQGKLANLLELIVKKLAKGKCISVIASELEEDEKTIQQLIETHKLM